MAGDKATRRRFVRFLILWPTITSGAILLRYRTTWEVLVFAALLAFTGVALDYSIDRWFERNGSGR